MDPNPNPNRGTVRPGLAGKGLLDRDRSSDRVTGAVEGNEERVTLRIDLPAVMGGERFANELLVAGEQMAVLLSPDLLEQRGRPFDVREQEGDRAAQTLRRAPPWRRCSARRRAVSTCEMG